MTSAPEHNDLTTWLQAHLSTLYEPPATADDADFQASFNSTFSPSAQIIVNHQMSSLDQFKDNLLSSKAAMTRATVHWKEVMQVDSPSEKSGIVAGFFVVTRTMKFRIRASPAQNNGYNSFSAKIDQDPGAPSAAEDNWRITQLFLTTENKAAQIHLKSAAEPFDTATVNPSLIEQTHGVV
ncbi:hypothetical protein BDQ12DRAFT_727167 [Crucibulum laeve]|uniref:SnoaL-like domain-containing protein n=1 Tax=Crucibulum laeve TaxID=68775 RepID=A0A5C3LLW0_9AGAR|nr:hypothetical protein BDQ12DRAFT_727167 [Crucibulum laeve]